MKILIILGGLLIYLYFTCSVLFYMPKIWPDEAYLADIAQNFATSGRLGTDLWGDMFTGTRNNFYWYPPLYILILATSFKIFGFSILTQRGLSIFLGSCLILILFILFQKIIHQIGRDHKKATISVIIIALLAADQTFLKGSRIGRADILVLFLGFLAFLLYELRNHQKSYLLYLGSGLLSGLAVLAHFSGVIFFIAIFFDNFFKKGDKFIKLSVFTISFLVPVISWFIYIYPHYAIFWEQLSLQAHFRQVIKSHILFILQQNILEYKIILLIYIILTIIVVRLALRLKHFSYLGIALLLGWFLYLIGELEWYMIYIVPLIYILSSLSVYYLLLSKRKNDKFLSVFLSILLSTLFLLHIKSHLKQVIGYPQYQKSYSQLIYKIKSHIPLNSVVYLSSIPDLYFNLKDQYQLYEFPNLLPKEDKYIEVLSSSDFIIINYHLEKMLVGELLIKYIGQNTQQELVFPQLDNDPVSVIRLKPRNARINPTNPTAH